MNPLLIAAVVCVLVFAYIATRLMQLLLIKSEYSLWEKILYSPCYTLARLLWRVRTIDSKKVANLPLKGGVLIANHRCSLDPFFVQLAAGRRVHWMVAAEYFQHPLFGKILRLFQAIPTRRSGSDNAATKQAVRLASEGRLVGMFPEGRLNRTRSPLISMRPGVLLVARKADVPIIPLWIRGAPIGADVWNPLFMPASVRIRIGQDFRVPDASQLVSRESQSSWLQKQMLDAKFGGR